MKTNIEIETKYNIGDVVYPNDVQRPITITGCNIDYNDGKPELKHYYGVYKKGGKPQKFIENSINLEPLTFDFNVKDRVVEEYSGDECVIFHRFSSLGVKRYAIKFDDGDCNIVAEHRIKKIK